MSGLILTCNAGSHNTKLAALDAETLEPIGNHKAQSNEEAQAWLASFGAHGTVMAIGHRVVHGGRDFTQPERITPQLLDRLKSLISLAPLHQPAAIRLIEEAQTLYPKVPHIACFDTAFHHTMPELQRRFALPQSFHDEGIMRYGFHGLSYEYIASVMPDMMPDHERVIVAHLGGGSSACAIHNGQSVASTMGFSTLDGLMMGSRCGALDAGVLLYLLQAKNMSADHLSDLLYHGAGLKGVSGISGDMQELLASDTPSARLAVDLFGSMAASQIAGLMPALGGLDALIFTGGIGEHAAPIRDKITALLRWVGEFKVHTIPTNEELVMARTCLAFSNALQRKATSRWENEGGAIINMEQKTHVNSNN